VLRALKSDISGYQMNHFWGLNPKDFRDGGLPLSIHFRKALNVGDFAHVLDHLEAQR
jgi:hypothetical protein